MFFLLGVWVVYCNTENKLCLRKGCRWPDGRVWGILHQTVRHLWLLWFSLANQQSAVFKLHPLDRNVSQRIMEKTGMNEVVLLVSFTTFAKGRHKNVLWTELRWTARWKRGLKLNSAELKWTHLMKEGSVLSGRGKMKGPYADVFGPPGVVNSARGLWGPYRDEGHWPHYISAKTETRTDNAATHWRLRWPECMGVCVREEILSVCVCNTAVFSSHASNDGEARLAGRAERKYTKQTEEPDGAVMSCFKSNMASREDHELR